MSPNFYLVTHVAGVLLLFTALGGAALHSANGGTKADNPSRKLVAAAHGIALVVILVAGFGMAGKSGYFEGGMPGWIIAKLVLWLLFGAITVPLGRKAGSGKVLFWALPALGALTAWLAVFKPF